MKGIIIIYRFILFSEINESISDDSDWVLASRMYYDREISRAGFSF